MTDDLVFEEPPPRARRSKHYPLLLALKDHPGKFVRVKLNLDEKAANLLTTQVRSAAAKLGNGWEVVSRYRPEDDAYGVWAKYVAAPGDEPPEDQAKQMVADTMGLIGGEVVGDGSGQALPPIKDEWETPVRLTGGGG